MNHEWTRITSIASASFVFIRGSKPLSVFIRVHLWFPILNVLIPGVYFIAGILYLHTTYVAL
jgi:hypothetical protein